MLDVGFLKDGSINLNPNYRGRVRSGCLTCRSKKVRCDEQLPQCRRCVRLQLKCSWPQQARKSHQPASSTPCDPGDVEPFVESPSSPLTPSIPRRAANRHESCPPGHIPGWIDHGSPFTVTQDLSQAQERSLTDSAALSMMTSQDIYLCTTIDWLAAQDSHQRLSFSYFLASVDIPFLTPYDPINWKHFKVRAVELAGRFSSIAASITALQWLFRAQNSYLPTSFAVSQYKEAFRMFESVASAEDVSHEDVLVNAFLLSLSSAIVLDDVACLFMDPESTLHKLMVPQGDRWTPLTRRIYAWLEILHASARRGGNGGFLLAQTYELLLSHGKDELQQPLLSMGDEASTVKLIVPVFKFYLELQRISLRIANLSHYHRSRTTATDQEQVIKLMATVKDDIHSLWHARPSLMRLISDKIRGQAAPSTSNILLSVIGVVKAAYFAELIEIGRNLSESLSITLEAMDAMHSIRTVIHGDYEVYHNGKLNAGYLRPLFLCAIESPDDKVTDWALRQMKSIQDPISRSEFFTGYATQLVAEQKVRKRRVTTRWLCYQNYGMRPPYL
jgi:hypothetical protein